jgi:hypothetical protein
MILFELFNRVSSNHEDVDDDDCCRLSFGNEFLLFTSAIGALVTVVLIIIIVEAGAIVGCKIVAGTFVGAINVGYAIDDSCGGGMYGSGNGYGIGIGCGGAL